MLLLCYFYSLPLLLLLLLLLFIIVIIVIISDSESPHLNIGNRPAIRFSGSSGELRSPSQRISWVGRRTGLLLMLLLLLTVVVVSVFFCHCVFLKNNYNNNNNNKIHQELVPSLVVEAKELVQEHLEKTIGFVVVVFIINCYYYYDI